MTNKFYSDLEREFFDSLSDGFRYVGCDADWNDFDDALEIIAAKAKQLATPGMDKDEITDNVETVLDIIADYSLDGLPSIRPYIYTEIEGNTK